MTPEPLDRLVRRVIAQARRRRAEHFALRGVFWGALAAVPVLLAKGPLGAWALPAAAGLVVVAALLGALWGATRRTTRLDAARLADRAFALDDRVATAVEWAERPDRTPLVAPLVADAVARVSALDRRPIVRRIVPAETRFLPIPIVVALSLVLAPPVPMPSGQLPDFSAGGDQEDAEQHTGGSLLEEREKPIQPDRLKPPAFEERELTARSGAAGASMSGDLAAVFKDTALASQRPDFNSFLKKGDDRLKLLQQADRLPDLQADYTTSQYKMIFRKSKALSSGLRPDQVSPQKLRELLKEMDRLGRKGGGDWSQDAQEGMEALEGGKPDKAMEAMQKALDKMRAQEEASRAGKSLRGGPDANRGNGRGRDRGRQGQGGADDEDFGDGTGLLPGKGTSSAPKGEATERLKTMPYDVGLEGEMRRGRKQAYNTNMTGRGGPMGSRLPYLGVIGQYRKMMEDEITREAVPREYHEQIKEYFQSLDER